MLQTQQTLFIARFVQLVDQGGGSGEADRETLLACGQTESEGHVSLAGAAVADCDDVLAAGARRPPRPIPNQGLVYSTGGAGVRTVRALYPPEAGRPSPRR